MRWEVNLKATRENLKRLLAESGKTIDEVAEELNATRSSVSSCLYLSKTISLQMMVNLCLYFGADMDDVVVVGGKNEKDNFRCPIGTADDASRR